MIIYFADRYFNILGQASTELPEGLTVIDDKKSEDIETGLPVFECTIPFVKETRSNVCSYTEVGNYILRSHNGENEFFTIIEAEINTKNQEVYIYAEGAGLDLLNEVVGEFTADTTYPIEYYIEKYAADAGFVIGINEMEGVYRQLSWESENTATERIADIAAEFEDCEISFSFDIEGLEVKQKYINIYKQRGQDVGITLRLNQDIDSIVTTKTIANLATALYCTGGTPDDADEAITLDGFGYDDGEDFYVDGKVLKSRKALDKWNRYFWKNDGSEQSSGHITKIFSSKALDQQTLCDEAIEELKKVCDIEVNYEAEIPKFPTSARIGDRVNIVDRAGELYLSTRILKLETSVTNQENKATFGEYLLKGSGISQKVIDLAEQFAKTSQSAARALVIANNAKTAASEAKTQAETAAEGATDALNTANEAKTAADTATQSAATAKTAADNAQAAVDTVEEEVAALEVTVANAQSAAEQAQQAAETAEIKATEAHTAAVNAQQQAETAETAANDAKTAADQATEKATTAQGKAEQALSDAEGAITTAAAAKLDAEQAQADIDALGENLTTLENTMQADYARKTDLTEASASLQTQITQNAAEISSTASRVQVIDETANNAQAQAEAAQTKADEAQATADQATADAQAAQTAANEAATAAANAQSEADTAKAAAATAQGVADKAEADLEAAKADLATVASRVDATEEDIIAAQEAVNAAQAAADKANADAETAAQKATEAQQTADTAVTNAATAQQAAKDAADKATIAQATADEAKGDAAAAKTAANEAKAEAEAAQATANTAKTNAELAQSKADEAATAAATAQKAADDADEKAATAAADLETAKQNLAAVSAKADATEAEVAEAQAAVEAAQAAADKAQTEAEAAQATADTAKANAATAQTAADNAKSAADAAQKAADDAQAAADEAQAAVDALAVRVTKTETDIVQTNEQIALLATKEEVTETLGGYYTKEETDAAIQVSADEINLTVSETKTVADSAETRVSVAESEIKQLADMIAMLVTDENGASLMTQTENGWTFSLADVQNKLDSTAADVDGLSGDFSSMENMVSMLQQAITDLSIMADYVIIKTYNGQPCIELGENDNDFKVRITNTEIQFADGTTVPAYINNKKLMIEIAEVKKELQFSVNWIWKKRANGNLGLQWKEVVE